jgi:hypothetical protein
MSVRFRILAGFLLASPASGMAADAPPEAAVVDHPVFLALAAPLAKSVEADESGAPGKPSLLTASTPPIGTQTVATRDAQGRVQVRCREVPLHDVRIHPRQPEQQP